MASYITHNAVQLPVNSGAVDLALTSYLAKECTDAAVL